MKKNQQENGITLIALVITIIVLLILAGVTIAMLTGDNGILGRAQKAVEENQKATDKEKEDLDKLANLLNQNDEPVSNPNIKKAGVLNANFMMSEDDGSWNIMDSDFSNLESDIIIELNSVSEWTLHVNINSKEDNEACYIRIKAFSTQGVSLEMKDAYR